MLVYIAIPQLNAKTIPGLQKMKIFATICIVGALLLSVGILYLVEKADFSPVTNAGGCDEFVCSVTNETGSFCRLSSTAYRAYPSMNTTAGYRDCINRATGQRGTWSVVTVPPVVFEREQCLFLDNVTMCFMSSNVHEDAQIRDAVLNASQSGPP